MAETCRNSQLFTKVHPYLFHDSLNYCPISSAFLRIHPPPSPSRSRSPGSRPSQAPAFDPRSPGDASPSPRPGSRGIRSCVAGGPREDCLWCTESDPRNTEDFMGFEGDVITHMLHVWYIYLHLP